MLNLSSLVPLQLFGQAFVVAISARLARQRCAPPSLYTNLMKWEQGKARQLTGSHLVVITTT